MLQKGGGPGSPVLLEAADAALQTSLATEVIPDPMDGEQTWPTDEELRQAQALGSQPSFLAPNADNLCL